MLQALAIGVAILIDRREERSTRGGPATSDIWAALLFTPGSVIMFFKSGLLAWNGLFCWWIPLAVFVL